MRSSFENMDVAVKQEGVHIVEGLETTDAKFHHIKKNPVNQNIQMNL